MSESKFTPGPWRAIKNSSYIEISSEHGGIGDACMSGHAFDGGDCFGDTATANANLIAAAPELLEACLRIQAQFRQAGVESKAGSLNPIEDNAAQVDAVIFKALGGRSE